jgi:hypothetical protein
MRGEAVKIFAISDEFDGEAAEAGKRAFLNAAERERRLRRAAEQARRDSGPRLFEAEE